MDGEQELGLLVAELGKVEQEGEELGQVFQMRSSCPRFQKVEQGSDKPEFKFICTQFGHKNEKRLKPGDRRAAADFCALRLVGEIVLVGRQPGQQVLGAVSGSQLLRVVG